MNNKLVCSCPDEVGYRERDPNCPIHNIEPVEAEGKPCNCGCPHCRYNYPYAEILEETVRTRVATDNNNNAGDL